MKLYLASGVSKKLDDDPLTNNFLKAHMGSMRMEIEVSYTRKREVYHSCFQLHNQVEGAKNRKTNLPPCKFKMEVNGQDKDCTEHALPASDLCHKRKLLLIPQWIGR